MGNPSLTPEDPTGNKPGGNKPGGNNPGGSSGGSSGGGGGGGSSSGGGGGGGNTDAKRRQRAQRIRRFKLMLQDWGIPLTKGLKKLINKGGKKEWGTDDFLYFLRKSKSYKKRFPGIKLKDGNRLSENQYISYERGYRLAAQQFGRAVPQALVASLIRNGVEPDDFALRLEAVNRVQQSPEIAQHLQTVLQRRGLITGSLDINDVYRFVAGQAPASWNAAWEEVAVRATATQAGLAFGIDISDDDIAAIADRIPGFQKEGELTESFTNLAKNIRSLIPLSRMARFGLTSDDLIELEFGGPRQAEIASLAERIVAQTQAAQQNEAVTSPGPEPQQVTAQQRARRVQSQ